MPFRDHNRVSSRGFNRMFGLFLSALTHVRPCSGAGGRTSVQVGVKKTKAPEKREAAHTYRPNSQLSPSPGREK